MTNLTRVPPATATIVQQAIKAAPQAHEQAGLKLDAARYNWMAKHIANGNFDILESAFAVLARVDSCTKKDLDAAIDAAMKRGAK